MCACCTPECFLILGSATLYSTPSLHHCTDRVELSLQMPTEGKLRLLPTEQMAETGLQGQGVCSSICPRVAIACYSHLRTADSHREQREAGTARGSSPEQAAGRVILKVIRWPVQGALSYGLLIRGDQSRHLQSCWPRMLGETAPGGQSQKVLKPG